jgi:hypothetical protein
MKKLGLLTERPESLKEYSGGTSGPFSPGGSGPQPHRSHHLRPRVPAQHDNAVPIPSSGNWARQTPSQAALPSTPKRARAAPLKPKPRPSRQDALEILSRDVHAILNKITPQTFDKLSDKLLRLNIESDALLEKVLHHFTHVLIILITKAA